MPPLRPNESGSANSLAAANWFLLLAGGLAIVLIVLRTRKEEQTLAARFGEEYLARARRIGRFWPRIGAPPEGWGARSRNEMPIDHVELFVPDRQEAAEWYRRALGCEVLEEYRSWATGTGPLMISNDGGDTKLALFEGPPQAGEEPRGFRRVAFRLTAQEFVDFLRSSGEWRAAPLDEADAVDHGKSISVYFSDPYGNQLEVTSYEHAAVRAELG